MLKNKNKIWLFIELAVITILGIGYAAINTIVLEIEGTGKTDVQDGVFITDVECISNVDANLSTSQVKNFIGTTMNSTIELSKTNLNSEIVYKVSVYNSSAKNCTFLGVFYNTENYDNPDIGFEIMSEGFKVGDIIAPKENKEIYIKFKYSGTAIPSNNVLNSYLNFKIKEPNMLKAAKETGDFFDVVDRTKIKAISFELGKVPQNYEQTFDASALKNNSIIGYITSTDDGNYNITFSSNDPIFANTDSSNLFFGLTNLTNVNFNNFDTSKATNISSMFNNCLGLTTLDLSKFNTSNVTNMGVMFSGCWSLTSLDLSSFDTSGVTNMAGVFYMCSKLTSLNLSSFNTNSVTDMDSMFSGCGITSLNLSNFDTSNVTNMNRMFSGCGKLASLNLSSFNTSNVTSMISMFNGCNNLTSLNLSSFNTSNVTNMSGIFNGCSSLTSLSLSNFDASNVTSMISMFSGCGKLASLNLSSFNTSNVTSMISMFNGCNNLTSLDLSNFNTSNVTSMKSMFNGCSNLTSLDLSNFNTSNVTNMNGMFNSCDSLEELNLINFDTSNVTNTATMFGECTKLVTIYVSEKFKTDKITTSGSMFSNCTSLVGENGTKYDNSNIDKVYARIDKPNSPGYFTGLPTIPEGFYYVGGTRESGMVISDNKNDENKGVDYTCIGNQFVWVPVKDYSKFVRGAPQETLTNSGIYKMTGTLDSKYTEPYSSAAYWENVEYSAMKNSVQKYKGFYIARFEAGDGDATSARKDVTAAHKVVSKKGAFVYNEVPWGKTMSDTSTQTLNDVENVAGAVELSRNMYKDSASVVSTLCYGVQWDATMNFVSDANHNIKNSNSWGNYSGSTGNAKTSSGVLRTTGKNEAWKVKNIYDLAGNASEWTMEAGSTSNRVIRGGRFYDDGSASPASTRNTSCLIDDTDYRVGFRVALYIKVPEIFVDGIKIPEGFYYVGGTKENGIVISDNADDENKGVDYTCIGNQFVWVPVEYTATGVADTNGLDTGFTSVFKRGTVQETTTGSGIYKMTGTLSTYFAEPWEYGYATEKQEYYTMMKSVEKNRGFYIARFEAGDSDATDGTSGVTKGKRAKVTTAHKVVSKKNAFVYNYVPWGKSMSDTSAQTLNNVDNVAGAVELSKNMYKDSTSVVSTLCYGVQWDATMNFVSDAAHNINNSVKWGNYSNSTGEAATNSGSSNMNYITGRNEAWKAKNIYDLAGNIYEWTMEATTSINRVYRGGVYSLAGSSYPASYRSSMGPTSAISSIGFRVALYIQ